MQRRRPLNVLACAAVGVTAALCSASLLAQASRPHAETSKAFNGTSLAGWKPRGAAQWRAANGEIAGSAASGPGHLVLDKSYQDIVIELAFQCQGCDAGVLLRDAAAAPNAGAFDVGIAGASALTLSRVSIDAQGKESERTEWFKWNSRRNPPGLQLSITPGANGWQRVRIQVRGDVTRPPAPGAGGGAGSGGGAAQRAAAEKEAWPSYGRLALRLTSGELRVKDVTVIDLLRPPAGPAPEMTASTFKRVELTDRFYAEGISAGDINNDGVVDALSGPYAYLGPTYERAIEIYRPSVNPIANATNGGQYTDNFLSYVHDFTGDGWNDYLKVNFNGAYLYVNPKGESRYWTTMQVTEQGVSSETTQLGDIDGDGKPELLGSIGSGASRVVGYWKPGADATARWAWVPISEKADWGGHAYGLGDLNGDGKVDIVQGSGWWAQPAAGAASGPWAFTAVPFGRGTDAFVRGADVFVYDVNGDKLPDVVTSLFAHGPGLVWFEQQKGSGAAASVTWKMHMIMDSPEIPVDERKDWEITDKRFAFTELHAVQVIDMDGDGLKDIVTGKRWLSHGFEWGENDRDDPPVVAWFKLVRKGGGQVEFVPHVINNYVGLGTQIAVTDVNGDSRPDVLTAARKGAHIFLNNMPRATGKSSGTSQ